MELRAAVTTLATHCSSDGQYVRWLGASGYPVENRYETSKTEIVRGIGGAQFKIAKPSGLDPVGCTNGLVPNFIHSLDSAHLVRVSCEAAKANIEMLPIHDCYATLAPDSAALHRIIRRELFLMYQNRDYIAELFAINGATLPLPHYGNLNLELILESQYSFA
jgi:DNA-directed RNA polymerase